MRINPKWVDATERKISALAEGESFSVNTTFPQQAQAVVLMLLRNKIPYKIFNLGAGVKRITTAIDECPICRRKI